MRWFRPRSSLLLVLLAGSCASEGERPTARELPSFVLLMADDQGWGELGARDHPFLRTPELDALAAQGLSLERFYAAAPVCSPTRGSVLTGRHPNRYGCFSWGHEVPGSEVTLAEILRARGYATGHFGKWHVGSVRAGEPTSPGEQGFEEWLSSPNYFDLDPLFSHRGEVVATKGEGSQVVVDAALRFITEAERTGRPFLAVIWFGSPHLPHEARSEDAAAFAHVPEPGRAYCAEIAGIDHSVGHLRRELRRLGIAERTLVWYTSDNGPRPPKEPSEFGEASTAGLRGRKGSLWEGGLRVPALVEWPGHIAPGTMSDRVAGTIDILPTVLALAGAAPPEGRLLDGESLAPLFAGGDWKRSRPLGFWVRPAKGRLMHGEEILLAQQRGEPDPHGPVPAPDASTDALPGSAAWIDGAFKLHRIVSEDETRYELYDLASDPKERNDLGPSRPELVKELRTAMQTWQESVAASFAGAE